MDYADAARGYYDAIDDDAYDDLRALLAPEFRQFRPDRTLEGREGFVEFMATERPRMDTVHAVDTVFVEADDDDETATEVAVRGRVFGDDGEELFAFVDVFRFEGDEVVELRTYTQ